jgi:2-methylcitrate dehydratase PrpD
MIDDALPGCEEIGLENRMTLAQTFAAFTEDTAGLSPQARAAALRAVFDLIGCALAGRSTAGGTAALKAAPDTWGAGPASCWFSDLRLAVPGAAFVNAAFASMLDLDDGHRAASGHPGAPVIPAVLATAESQGADVERVLTAIAIGYEVGVRIAGARDVEMLHTFDSGLWCGQGVAAAVSWLRRLGPERTAHAIAIAGTTAPGQTATGFTKHMGNNVKEGIPFATALGLVAVELAAAGYTGPVDLLDDPARYDRSVLLSGLGGGSWMIETTYFKPYGACRWAHAAIDAVLEIKARHRIAAGAIENIHIETFTQALSLNNEVAPATLESAQYSVPFCVAAAAVHGAEALLPMEPWLLKDAAVLAVSPRVTLSIAADLDPMFPRRVPARVIVRTAQGSHAATVLAPRGEPVNPMSDDDLKAKFFTIADRQIAPRASAALLDAFDSFRAGELAPLLAALGGTPALAQTAAAV